jgi:type VI secretion system protein ImpJ
MNGRDEKPVELGRKNFRLILDIEAGEDVVTLPVGRALRDGSGHFIYDRSFVPPLLDIAASEHLMGLLRRLCDLLDEKGRAVTAERDPSTSIADHYRRELPSFWFLHTVFTSLGSLRHILLARRSHPEHLYKEMLRLAGGLCCFALNAHPKDLPIYNHEDLRGCFETLDERIRTWLELVVRTNCVVLELKNLAPYYWNTPVHDPRLFDRSRWLLEVRCNVGEATVISRTPRLVKVCSERFVTELVRRAVPGLTLTHLPSPPPEIATKVDAQYFSLSKAGPCWDDIVHTQRFGIYVPGDLPDPQLALHVIVER